MVLGNWVEDVTAQGVTLSGQHVPARTARWATGVMASPPAAWLGVKLDRSGRVTVGADLGVAELDGVYAIGDTAASDRWAGDAVPGLAPAAKQGGAHVARVIRSRLAGRPGAAAVPLSLPGQPGDYRVAVGGGGFRVPAGAGGAGAVAVGAAHIAVLAGGRNCATELVQWVWAYLTFCRGTRLITGR